MLWADNLYENNIAIKTKQNKNKNKNKNKKQNKTKTKTKQNEKTRFTSRRTSHSDSFKELLFKIVFFLSIQLIYLNLKYLTFISTIIVKCASFYYSLGISTVQPRSKKGKVSSLLNKRKKMGNVAKICQHWERKRKIGKVLCRQV